MTAGLLTTDRLIAHFTGCISDKAAGITKQKSCDRLTAYKTPPVSSLFIENVSNYVVLV